MMFAALSVVVAFFGKLPWEVWVLLALVIGGVFLYHQGDVNGAAAVQSKWDTTVAAAKVASDNLASAANASAQLSVPPLTAAQQASDAAIAPVPGRPKPCSVPSPFDRDCAK